MVVTKSKLTVEEINPKQKRSKLYVETVPGNSAQLI